MRPPEPPRRPHVHALHGVEREDPWAWMQDPEDPDLLAHLHAENAYTRAATDHLDRVRDALFHELLDRIEEDDTTAPVRQRDWWYLSRTVKGLSYPIHLRRHRTRDAPDEVLLDENALAEGKPYLELGAIAVNPEATLLAYAVDELGNERYRLRIRDLATGLDLPDVLEDIWPDLAWASDGRTVLYARMDESMRPHEIWAHTLGSTEDQRVYHEPDTRFRVFTHRTRDERWLLVGSGSSTTTEFHFSPADQPLGPYTLLTARHPGHEHHLESHAGRFLVLTNDANDAQGNHTDDAVSFALKEADPAQPDRAHWRTLIPARPHVTLEGVVAFAKALVVLEREDGLTHLRVIGPGTRDVRVPMEEPSFVLEADSNPEVTATSFRYRYTSLTTPPSVRELDLDTLVSTELKQQIVRGGYDASLYLSERLDVPSHDGVLVPVSIVRRRDTPVDGTAPALVYAYGAYGLTIDPSFSSTRLSLLDRGVVYAIVHARGGGFLGTPWKEAGKLHRKANTFADVIAGAQALVDRGLAHKNRLALMGGSAGGLMVGAVLNAAPHLFRIAVAQVPFVDVVTTMLDADLPLTTNEWEEWGNPQDKGAFEAMLAWSPYDNVQRQPYPDLLVTSGLHDPRVMFWEPVKWVARLRERATNAPQVLLKMEMTSGHGGKSGRYGQLEELAFEDAWLLERWGLATALASDATS